MEIQAIKIRLGKLRTPIIKTGIKLIDKWLIEKIPFVPLKSLLQENLGLLGDVTDVMTDKDPNNMEQLEGVWNDHKEKSLESLERTAKTTINQLVKNPINAAILTGLLDEMLAEQADEEKVAAIVTKRKELEQTTA